MQLSLLLNTTKYSQNLSMFIFSYHNEMWTTLCKVSIKTNQAYKYLIHWVGGYDYVEFTLKNLYNNLDLEMREVSVVGNTEAAIIFMNLLKSFVWPEILLFF